MNLNILFKISAALLLINGVLATFMPHIFIGQAGMTLTDDVTTITQAFGTSLLVLSYIIYRMPSISSDIKDAGMIAVIVYLAFIILISVHLYTGQASGLTPMVNLGLNIVMGALFYFKSK
tara:strand:+ start:500 stop:859 length:360 start_codon:yes stop_codon:yes gene_type:complete